MERTKDSSLDLSSLLESYSQYMKVFAYEKAKELVEEAKIGGPGVELSPWWVSLMNALSQLTLAERSYYSFSFLLPKGFLRKESALRSNYNAIRSDLLRIPEMVDHGEKTKSENSGEMTSEVASSSPRQPVARYGLVEHLVQQLLAYVVARIDMMNFYEKLSLLGTGKALSLEDVLQILDDIISKHSGTFTHPLLSHLESAFMSECEVLIHLLRGQLTISKFEFLSSLIHLQEAQSRLVHWAGKVAPLQEQQSSWFGLGSGSSESSQKHPVLCQWLKKYYDALVSKFSLYFLDILSRQDTPHNFNRHWNKLSSCVHHRIVNFQRRSDVAYVCFILNASGMDDFQGLGYHHPDREPDSRCGLENYPIMVSFPPPSKPTAHLPALVMILCRNSESLAQTNRAVFFADPQNQVSYFLSRVEGNLYLALIFNGRKSEKDSNVHTFSQEISTQLRCLDIFASLKAAAK